MLLRDGNCALEIDADVDLPAILHGLAAPNALLIFPKFRDVRVAGRFETAFHLSFGEAVSARLKLGARQRSWLLGKCSRRDKKGGQGRQCEILAHLHSFGVGGVHYKPLKRTLVPHSAILIV